MMRLFLIEKNGDRKIDLGLFKFNDEAQCIAAAQRRHKFLAKMQSNGFGFKGELENGPLRREKPVKREFEQLSISA
jgi:hypothetical protein